MTVQKQVDISALASAVKVPADIATRFQALGDRRAALEETIQRLMQAAVHQVNIETQAINLETKMLWDETTHALGLVASQDLNLESGDPENAYVFSGQEYRAAAEKLGMEACGGCGELTPAGGAGVPEAPVEQIHDSLS
jgi:hypothetical protein